MILTSCSSSNHLDARLKAKKSIEKLTIYFSQVHSKEDLKIESKKIKKELEKLVKLMILLRKEQLKSTDSHTVLVLNLYQERFEKEFNRVIAIEGCEEIYRNLSVDALYLLDAFDRKIQFPTKARAKTKKIEDC